MGQLESIKAIRASIMDVKCVVDRPEDIEKNMRYIDDGLMLIIDGKIEWVGKWEEGKDKVPPGVRIRSYPGKIVMPGFIDTHVHYPQSEMVGAYGEQLLEWLDNYVFPTEARYSDKDYSRRCLSSSLTSYYAMAPLLRWCLALCTQNRSTLYLKSRKVTICA